MNRLPGRALLRRGRPVSLILLDCDAKLPEEEGDFHGDMVVSLVGPSVREEFLAHANEELRHADILAERIQQLGGVPISDPAKIARTVAEAHVNVTQGAMVEALAREDRRNARALLDECVALRRERGDSSGLIHTLGAMGHLVRDDGDYASARAIYRESLMLRRDLGHRIAVAQSLEDLAVLAGREKQAERAIRILGAAEVFCGTFGARSPVADPTEYERTVAEGRAALGEKAFAAAWAAGRAMPLEEAINYALHDGSDGARLEPNDT